jgi:hypothetical protein
MRWPGKETLERAKLSLEVLLLLLLLLLLAHELGKDRHAAAKLALAAK